MISGFFRIALIFSAFSVWGVATAATLEDVRITTPRSSDEGAILCGTSVVSEWRADPDRGTAVAVAGALAGGLIGSQVGAGTGRAAAVVIGGVVGSQTAHRRYESRAHGRWVAGDVYRCTWLPPPGIAYVPR